jgi:hypothetical protein
MADKFRLAQPWFSRATAEGGQRSLSEYQSKLDAMLIYHAATLATNFLFEGGRADLTKNLSANPAFQVTHSFALGSQATPSSYNFGAIVANENVRRK